LKIFLKVSTLDKNGPSANLFSKLEIKPTVVLAGLLELLKLCPIEFASLLEVNSKQEFLLKILFLAAILAEMDATEDTLMPLGNIGLTLVLLLEIYTTLPTGANPMLCLPVTTMLLELLNPAPLQLIPLLVNINAEMDGMFLMMMIKPSELPLSEFPIMLLLSKLN